jgi:hypothetical protein
MAMTTCSECKGKISAKALLCPHCGFGMERALADAVRQQVQEAFQASLTRQPQAMSPGAEKRRHRRIDHNTTARVNGETAMLFNISRSGLKLSSPFTPQIGNVDISLETGETIFALQGVIR